MIINRAINYIYRKGLDYRTAKRKPLKHLLSLILKTNKLEFAFKIWEFTIYQQMHNLNTFFKFIYFLFLNYTTYTFSFFSTDCKVGSWGLCGHYWSPSPGYLDTILIYFIYTYNLIYNIIMIYIIIYFWLYHLKEICCIGICYI